MPIKNPHITLLSLILLHSLLHVTHGVKFIIINNATKTVGGRRFEKGIGRTYTIRTLGTITNFIWQIFRQNTTAQRKNVPVLNVYITELSDAVAGQTGGDNIYINRKAIEAFPLGRARFDFNRIMYHETTHIFQWSGQGTAPGGLTEGVAEYVVLKSKFINTMGYTRPGEGKRWDEGYGVTARFLEYCDSLRPGFTPDLNNKMRQVYKDEYFLDLLGKPLNQVWREYKNKYGIPTVK